MIQKHGIRISLWVLREYACYLTDEKEKVKKEKRGREGKKEKEGEKNYSNQTNAVYIL